MPLANGTRLGPYEISGLLGAGGMGEVYRARDTRLERTVAVKVLPAEFAAEPTLRARFEREAHAISALQHPHICTLHDVGEHDGQFYLVMEHLGGKTLAERLKKGPLPLSQGLEIGAQIAEALAAAHKQGIVHRDLKPGNVMLTKTGAKLLDFGLARLAARGEGPPVEGLTSAPTKSGPLTGMGAILGTVPYMAPEQLEDKATDTRTDVWALGVVLYEMLTGERAFDGTSSASLVAAILEREPAPLSSLQPLTPPSLERLVRRCLAKSPDDRWDSAHDVADELRWIGESAASRTVGGATGAATPARRRQAAWGLVGLAAVLALAGYWATRERRVSPASAIQLELLPPYGTSYGSAVAVSPDGQSILFGATLRDGAAQLWLRRLDAATAEPLAGTEGASFPFWSPDGRSIAFFADKQLKRLDLGEHAPIVLCPAESGRGGTWMADGAVVFAPSIYTGLMRVRATGGLAAPLTQLDSAAGELSHRFPLALPSGRFLYQVLTIQESGSTLFETSVGHPHDKRQVAQGVSDGLYSNGTLYLVRRGVLLSQRFDPETASLGGVPVVVAGSTRYTGTLGRYVVSVSPGMIAVGGARPGERSLEWVDRSGGIISRVQVSDAIGVELSPDGQRAAVTRRAPSIRAEGLDIGAQAKISVVDLERGSARLLIDEPQMPDLEPLWSPDGALIAFSSPRGVAGNSPLYVVSVDGATTVEPGTDVTDRQMFPAGWSRDGWLVWVTFSPTGDQDIWMKPPKAKALPYLQTPAREKCGRLSRDGRWLAYATTDSSNRTEIAVRSFPKPDQMAQVSVAGGDQPRWRADGKELFYVEPSGRMMAVSVQTDPRLTVGKPRALFQTRLSGAGYEYDVSADGSRFLVNRVVEEDLSTLTIIITPHDKVTPP